jgi:thymidylate synthase ThyX
VHAELMTHRLFSRNSSSSRAIPQKKLREQVLNDPAMPVFWGKNQSGMQAREPLSPTDQEVAKVYWRAARDLAVEQSDQLVKVGLHKQLANRLLEPWMFITTIVTATEWENWYHLRDHPDAQPELAHLARMMREAFDQAYPMPLLEGGWHLPFIHLEDEEWAERVGYRLVDHIDSSREESVIGVLLKLSTARCARVSYLNHEGSLDRDKDIKLHRHLSESGHWSCFEHPAQALATDERSGNLFGWKSYRKFFPNEHVGRKLI